MITVLLLKQIVILFIMMGCGYLIVRTRLLTSEDSRVLSVLVVYLIMPCVIIKSFQIELTDNIIKGFIMATVSAVCIHLLLFVFTAALGKCIKLDQVEKASLIYSNSGNLIIPMVTAILGEEWVIYASAFLCVQMLFLWTHGQSLIKGEKAFSIDKILKNLNLIAVIVGFILMICKVKLPDVLYSTLGSISGTIGPVSMVMLGMMLAGMDMKRIFYNRKLYIISMIKMFIMPAVVLIIMKLSGIYTLTEDGSMIGYISILAVITPTATAVTQLAQLYNKDAEYSGAINAMTTLVCIVTMPLMTQLYMLM